MAIHCISVVYSPSTDMDSYIESWLTGWTAWSEEPFDSPSSKTFRSLESDTEVSASGFQGNRFQFEGVESEDRSPERDAKYIVSDLTGITGYLASYCDWWVIRWHRCDHDGVDPLGCGYINSEGDFEHGWKVLDSSNSYSEYQNVPNEVPQ